MQLCSISPHFYSRHCHQQVLHLLSVFEVYLRPCAVFLTPTLRRQAEHTVHVVEHVPDVGFSVIFAFWSPCFDYSPDGLYASQVVGTQYLHCRPVAIGKSVKLHEALFFPLFAFPFYDVRFTNVQGVSIAKSYRSAKLCFFHFFTSFFIFRHCPLANFSITPALTHLLMISLASYL